MPNTRSYIANRISYEQLSDGSFRYYLEVDPTRKRNLPIRVYLPEGQRVENEHLETKIFCLKNEIDFIKEERDSLKKECENYSRALLKLRDKISTIFELKDEFEFRKTLHEAYRAELSKQGFHCREEFAWWTFHRCDKCLPLGFFNSWETQPTANLNVYYSAWQSIQRQMRAILNPYLTVPKENG